MLMTNSDVKRFIKQFHDLPTTPALLGKILSLIKDETKSTDEIIDLISHDQAMAERVLRIANSAFFAHSGQIKDIQQAVLFLGLDRIKSIAVAMTVMNIFPAPGTFHIENLWLHSYEVAFLSAMMSERIALTQPQECFLAGLLHDIGRILLYTMDHTLFNTIETTDTMLEQETASFGCTHAEAGAWFAEGIGLPSGIVTTIKFHHKPSAAPDDMSMVSVVSMAEALTRMFRPRVEDDGIWIPEHDAILLEFSLGKNDLHDLERNFIEAQPDIERTFSDGAAENSLTGPAKGERKEK
jgi:putative nucleotidyltransferase with HDIG domain